MKPHLKRVLLPPRTLLAADGGYAWGCTADGDALTWVGSTVDDAYHAWFLANVREWSSWCGPRSVVLQ